MTAGRAVGGSVCESPSSLLNFNREINNSPTAEADSGTRREHWRNRSCHARGSLGRVKYVRFTTYVNVTQMTGNRAALTE